MVCELTCCQLPAVTGVTGGREVPRTWLTGFEKVSMIGVPGPMSVPGVGEATADALRPAGNQLTRVGAALSHCRAIAVTQTEPADVLRGSVITFCGEASVWRCQCPGAPYAKAETGMVKLTRSGAA